MKLRLALVLATALAARAARADEPAPPEDKPPPAASTRARWIWSALEIVAITTPQIVWYYADARPQAVDWNLRWDWPSWRQKIVTFQAVRFDTNPWASNGARHPMVGVSDYLITRSNGFGVLPSAAWVFTSAVLWEYFVEFREYPSPNDVMMNTTASLGIGEPLFQLGVYLHHDRGWLAEAVGAVANPFDELHHRVRGDPWPFGPMPWHRFRLRAGLAAGGAVGGEAVAGADLEFAAQPHYGDPIAPPSRITPGAFSRLAVELRVGAPDGRVGQTETLLRSRTALWGRYVASEGDGLFVGFGSGFLYQRRRLAGEWDRLAIGQLAGVQAELSRFRTDWTLRWHTGLYGDFALAQGWAFGPTPPFPRPPPYVSMLQAEGYYPAAGASLDTRVALDWRGGSAAVELDGHQLNKIDGWDRVQARDSLSDPHDVTDQRVFARAELELRPGGGAIGVGAIVEGALRRGAWREAPYHRTSTDASALLVVTYAP